MKNKKFSKALLLVAVILTAFTALIFIFFEGNTAASFTFANLTINLFIKAFVSVVLVFAVTTLYFCIRFKKKGVYLGIFTAICALVSGIVSLDLCVLCRAPLSDLTFAIILLSVIVTYVTSVVFANNFVKNNSKKKKNKETSAPYDKAVDKTRKAFSVPFVVMIITIVAGAVLSFVFSAFSLALCATPAILSAVYSFALSLSFGARLYAEKI